LPTPVRDLDGFSEICQPMMTMLAAGACTLGQIRASPAFTRRPISDLLQAVTMLMSAGFVHPALPPTESGGAGRLNAAIGAMNSVGYGIGWLASPAIGSALRADVLETLVIHDYAVGQSRDIVALTDRLLATLDRAGHSVRRDGQAVTDATEARAALRETVARMVEERLPMLARLGVIAG
jgi:hypothetical protein